MSSTLAQTAPRPSIFKERLALHLGLLVTTYLFVTGFAALSDPLAQALTFSTSLLGILLCHEMGHYVAGRIYGVDVSLPYFIPAPLGIGTFGAVIRIRSPIPTRTALLDIGAAGPLLGMAVAVPLLFFGMARSHFEAVPYRAGAHFPGQQSLIAVGLHLYGALHGGAGNPALLDQASAAMEKATVWTGDSLLTTLASRLFLGPTPPGTDVVLHPMAWAAWFGLLVTFFNLIPIGQLDGGHVAYAVFGPRIARGISQVANLALLLLAIVGSWSWLVWFLLTRFVVKLRHPPVVYPQQPLPASRLAIAAIALALLVLTFLPIPLEIRPGP
jgi:membrane-associated protease RseP (regulator of RpoE activity)